MFSPATFGRKLNPFSQEFRNALSDMANVVGQLQAWDQIISTLAARQAQKSEEVWFHAKITGKTTNGTQPIWKYSWKEVIPTTTTGGATDFQDLSGGRTGTSNAINCLESSNTSSLAYGFAVGLSGSDWKLTASGFTGIKFLPVPTNTIVQMFTVKTATTNAVRFEFWAPNPLDGTCA